MTARRRILAGVAGRTAGANIARLLRSAQQPLRRRFIGNVNLMDGVVVDDQNSSVTIECADCTHFVGHEGMEVCVALHPEKIFLSREEPPGPRNRVRGVVKEMSYFGSFSVYFLDLPSGARLKVSEENELRQADLGRRGVGELAGVGAGGADALTE
jgi:ABC-type Fe3+/spermidine/putrescine transport system ATPase subunit